MLEAHDRTPDQCLGFNSRLARHVVGTGSCFLLVHTHEARIWVGDLDEHLRISDEFAICS
jgi:hypothetical protein